MPIHKVSAPDGSVIQVEAPEGATEDQILAYAQANWKPTTQKTGYGAALSKGAETLVSQGTSGLSSLLNPEEAAKAGMVRGEGIDKRYADQTSLDTIRKIYNDPDKGLWPAAKEVVRQVPYAVLEQVPQLGASLASARLGAAAGSLAGPYGTVAGGALGLFAPSAIQALGGNVERQAQEQTKRKEDVKIDMPSAVGAAAVQGGLDAAGTVFGLGKGFVSKLAGIPEAMLAKKSAAELEKLATETTLRAIAKGGAKYLGAELPTEIGQQVLERAQAGLDLTSPEALEEYKKTAYTTALALPMGSVGRVQERGAARDKVVQNQQADAIKARDALAAQKAEADAAETARRGTPEYAAEVTKTYLDLEQKRRGLIASLTKIDPNSPTLDADKLANKEIQAEIARMSKEELPAAAAAYREVQKNNKAGPGAPPPPAPPGTPPVGPAQDLFGDAPTQPTDTAETVAAERERKRYGRESRAADMEDALDAADGTLPAEDSATDIEEQRTSLAQQLRALPDLLEKQREAAALAKTPEESIAAVALFNKTQQALNTAKTAFGQLPQAPAANTLQSQLASVTKKWELAKENGDTEAIGKHAARLVELNELGATQSTLPVDKTPWGSEATDSFNQRVVGPEMAAGRENAAASRAKLDAEIAALQRIKDGIVDTAYPQARQERKADTEIAGMEANRMNTGRTDQMSLLDTQPLQSRVVRGVGTEGRTFEELQRDLAEARRNKDRPAQEAALEALRDMRDRESTAVDKTAGAGGTSSPQASAHQDAVIARGQALSRLLMARGPEATEAARANLLERLAKEIEVVQGRRMSDDTKWTFAREANAVLDKLGNNTSSEIAASNAQKQLDDIRNRMVQRDAGPATETTFAPPEVPYRAPDAKTPAGPYKNTEGNQFSLLQPGPQSGPTATMASLQEQLARAQALGNLEPAQQETLSRVADNLEALAADPARSAAVADWLHQDLGIGPQVLPKGSTGADATTARQQDVNKALDTLEAGKRSETENVAGETRTAVQEDMFPNSDVQGTLFDSYPEFEAFLAGDALADVRKEEGLAVQTLSRAVAKVEPLQRKAAALRENLTRLQETYRIQEGNAEYANELAANKHAVATKRLNAVIAQLDAELAPLQAAVVKADIAHSKATDAAAKIADTIAKNTAKFNREPEVQKAAADVANAYRKHAANVFANGKQLSFDEVMAGSQALTQAINAQRTVLGKKPTERASLAFATKSATLQLRMEAALQTAEKTKEKLAKVKETLDWAYDIQQAEPETAAELRSAKQNRGKSAAAVPRTRDAYQAKLDATAAEIAPMDDERQRLAKEIDAELSPAMAAQAKRTETNTRRDIDPQAQARDAERTAKQGLTERLAELPGVRVTQEARRNAMEQLDSIPDQIAVLAEKTRDTTLSTTARREARVAIEQHVFRLEQATKLLSTEQESIAAAHATIDAKLREVEAGIEVHENIRMQPGLAKGKKEYRRDAIAALRRQAKLLHDTRRAITSPREITPIGGPYKAGTEEESVRNTALQSDAAAVRAEGLEAIRAAKEDRAAVGYLKQLFDMELDGKPTDRLSPRKKGPLTRSSVAAPAAFRSGDPTTRDARTTSGGNKVRQGGARQGVSGTQAVRDAAKDVATEQALLKVSHLESLQERNDDALALAEEAGDKALIAKHKGYATRLETARIKAQAALGDVVPKQRGVTEEAFGDDEGPGFFNDPFAGEHEANAYAKGVEAESPNLTATQVGHLENNDLTSALESIANDKTATPLARAVAQRTAIVLDATNVAVEDTLHAADGAEVLGSAVSGEIKLSRDGGLSQEVLLHESTHAAVERVLNLPETQLSPVQLTAKRELKALHAAIKNDPKVSSESAKGSLSEFSAEVMSNTQLQGQLKDKPWRLSNAWNGFKSAIMRLLGVTKVTNMRDAAMQAVDALMIPSSTRAGGAEVAVNESQRYAKAASYGEAKDTPLGKLAARSISKPMPILEQFKGVKSLWLRTKLEDKRAPAMEAARLGRYTTAESETLTQQFEYFQRKSDQLTPMVHAALTHGAPTLPTDSKGLRTVTMSGGTNAGEIMTAMQEVPYGDAQGKINLSTLYMKVQRVMNKRATIGEMGLEPGEAEAVMKQVDADPALKTALENVRKKTNEYFGGMLRFVGETGAIPKAEVERMLAEGDYVPLYQADEHGKGWLLMGSSRIALGDIRSQPYLHALKGGQGQILPLNESILQNTALLMNKGLKNLAAKSSAYMYQDLGAGSIGRGDGPKGPGVIRFNQEPDPKSKDDNGQRWMEIDTAGTVLEGIPNELMIQAIEGTHAVLPAFMKLGASAANLLRSGITRMPMYVLRQLWRDPMAATSSSALGTNPLTAVYRANKEYVAQMTGKSKIALEAELRGLIQSHIWTGDHGDMAKMAREIASGESAGAIGRFVRGLDKAAMTADAATRALLFQSHKAQGLSDMQAELATMSSMDHHQRGSSGTLQIAAQMIPFASAQIQALSVLRKAMTGKMPYNEQLKIKQRFMNNALMLFGTGLLYAAAMDDDEKYKNLPLKDRMNNFIVRIPGVDTPVRLPIAYEYGLPYSAAIALYESMKDDTRSADVTKAIRQTLMNSVPGAGSMGIPQLALPMLEVATNTSMYNLQPLVNHGQERLTPEEQFNNDTSEAAKSLARALPDALKVSPIKIEHVVKGYLGQAPIILAKWTNDLFATDNPAERPSGNISDKALYGSLFVKENGGADVSSAYEVANKAIAAKNTLKSISDGGRANDAAAFYKEHLSELKQEGMSRSFMAQMQKLKEREGAIRKAPATAMDADQRQKLLNEVDAKLDQVAKGFLKAAALAEN